MIVDANAIPEGTTLDAEVCVVGTGPAGIAVARELVAGRREVCLLESGGLEPEPESTALLDAEDAGEPYFALDRNRARQFGGTSTLWAGWCRWLDPIDFEARPWVPDSGWPIGETDLAPYYDRALEILGVDSQGTDLPHWERAFEVRRLPLPDDVVESKVYRLSPPARLGAACRQMLTSAPTARVLLHATALRLETGDARREVRGVEVGTCSGSRLVVRARHYVLAGGGIENARLLLLSGLGNDHDLVGRYFMEHLHFAAGVIALAPGVPWPQALYVRDGRTATARLFPTAAVQCREHLLNGNVMLEPVSLSSPIGAALGRLLGRRPVSSPADPALGRLRLPGGTRILRLHHTLEQAPNAASRITLGLTRDAFDLPRARVQWVTTSLDWHSAGRLRSVIGDAFAGAGLGKLVEFENDNDVVWPPEPLQGSRGHHMGTTRMSDDPRRGVVDARCRVHGLHNLHVAGSSVFPTAGAGVPTPTIVALALRLGEHLRSALPT